MPLTAQLGNDDGRLSACNVYAESNKRLSANRSVSENAHTHSNTRLVSFICMLTAGRVRPTYTLLYTFAL